jgi:hypothetical protein
MGHRLALVAIPGLLLGLVCLLAGARGDEPAKPAPLKPPDKAAFDKDIAPLVAKYCTTCHGGEKPKAGLNLEAFKDEAGVMKDRKTWEKVAENLRVKDMPPARKPQPTTEERDLLNGWLALKLGVVDCTLAKDPGRPTLHRLNRAEYNNTVRDLVGVDFKPADDFPSDDVAFGFDNVGDVLSLPPVMLEKYLAAAERITDEAFKNPELRKRIMVAEPGPKDKADKKAEAARKVIGEFARRAYRRPVTANEVNRLVTRFVDLADLNGDGFETGVRLALEAVLVSPNFLFRVEGDPDLASSTPHPLNDFELASRLSYFLWSSMPDEELFALAKDGKLSKDDNLEKQTRRMLKDPKARAFVENFGDQWLQIRVLRTLSPDPKLFPGWNDKLRADMITETELFFDAVVKEDRSILDFLDADFTFVNERLAAHYGIAGVKGEKFQRVKLTGEQRGGLLTQASVLTVTSNPTRTSPVKRGKWIMENILGTPPPPPPPNVPELKEKAAQSGSLRQRMEQHRADPNCATCHQRMDPLGFGFENFDAVGAWRTREGDFPIDPSGELPSGQKFNGPGELKGILKGQKDQFCRCLAEKLLTYAAGRGLESFDRCALDEITAAAARDQYKFTTLVLEVVKSDPFRLRRAKRGGK